MSDPNPGFAAVSRSLPTMSRFAVTLAAMLACAFPIALPAASVDVQVRDAAGKPVADAVVYALALSGAPDSRPRKTVAIEQVDREFVPYVSVVQAGTIVTFPNRDPILHHVYSFSPAKQFEYVIAPRNATAPMPLVRSTCIAELKATMPPV